MATPQLGVQTYLPTGRRRKSFTPGEQMAIEEGQDQWIPRIFTAQSDSPAVDMASPNKTGVLFGAPVGLAGGMLAGGLARSSGMSENAAAAVGTGAAGALGLLTFLLARQNRQADNETILERMRRIPANGTRRDVEADPVYQAELERANRLQAAYRANPTVG